MTSNSDSINWNTDPAPVARPLSSLVTIPDSHGGSHGLHLIATGPPRKPYQPVAIFEAGFGGDAHEFATVIRMVAEMGIIRCFTYNRMGMRESELRSDFKEDFEQLTKAEEEGAGPVEKDDRSGKEESKVPENSQEDEIKGQSPEKSITAMDCARELEALLIAAEIPGPYIIVAHSWAGIIMCQLLALKNPPIPLSGSKETPSIDLSYSKDQYDRIVGMIFIDANQESSHDSKDIYQLISLSQVIDQIDQSELLDYKTRCVREDGVTESEWTKVHDEKSWPLEWNIKKQMMFGGIIAGWNDSILTLKSYQILKRAENGFEPPLTFFDPVTGQKRGGFVSAIFARKTKEEAQAVYDEMIRRGLGSDEQREWLRNLIDSEGEKDRKMQKGFLKLAGEGRGRFVDAEESGHSVHMFEPELVAHEIRWVLGELEKA